jgi:hypothetical protein
LSICNFVRSAFTASSHSWSVKNMSPGLTNHEAFGSHHARPYHIPLSSPSHFLEVLGRDSHFNILGRRWYSRKGETNTYMSNVVFWPSEFSIVIICFELSVPGRRLNENTHIQRIWLAGREYLPVASTSRHWSPRIPPLVMKMLLVAKHEPREPWL